MFFAFKYRSYSKFLTKPIRNLPFIVNLLITVFYSPGAQFLRILKHFLLQHLPLLRIPRTRYIMSVMLVLRVGLCVLFHAVCLLRARCIVISDRINRTSLMNKDVRFIKVNIPNLTLF